MHDITSKCDHPSFCLFKLKWVAAHECSSEGVVPFKPFVYFLSVLTLHQEIFVYLRLFTSFGCVVLFSNPFVVSLSQSSWNSQSHLFLVQGVTMKPMSKRLNGVTAKNSENVWNTECSTSTRTTKHKCPVDGLSLSFLDHRRNTSVFVWKRSWIDKYILAFLSMFPSLVNSTFVAKKKIQRGNISNLWSKVLSMFHPSSVFTFQPWAGVSYISFHVSQLWPIKFLRQVFFCLGPLF